MTNIYILNTAAASVVISKFVSGYREWVSMLIGVGNGYIIKRRNNKFSSNIHRGNVYTTKDYGIEVIFCTTQYDPDRCSPEFHPGIRRFALSI